MSLTTENSIRRNRGNLTVFGPRLKGLLCPCLPTLRQVSPVSPLPENADFMTLGTKGKRLICVVHIDPGLSDTVFTLSSTLLAAHARKIVCDDACSDNSSDEYWFTKWTVPLRTVKFFQGQNISKLSVPAKSPLPAAAAADQGPVKTRQDDDHCIESPNASKISLKEPEALHEKPKSPSSHNIGVVNLGFVGSNGDPDATTSAPGSNGCMTVQQNSSQLKPLLFFIHGAGESSESWKSLMEYFLCLKYEVLALDLIGHGFSNTPKEKKSYTFKKILADVLSVFDAHVFSGRKAVVIAHGYGCSFGVALSRQRGPNVTLLALLSCGGPTPLAPPVAWRRETKLPASLLRCMRSFLPCGMKRNVFYGPRGKNCLHNSVHFQSLPSYVQKNLAVGQSWIEGDVAFHRKIVVPTLLVHGLKDKFVSLVEMCEMERTIPRAFLEVIPESGHDLMADVPDQLCKMIRKFIERWQR